jgi:putative transposase
VLVTQSGKRCEDLLRQMGDKTGWTIVERAVEPDHLHVFVRAWPSVSAAEGHVVDHPRRHRRDEQQRQKA